MSCLWCVGGKKHQPVLNSLNLFFGSETKRQYAIVPTFPQVFSVFMPEGVFLISRWCLQRAKPVVDF